MEVHAHTHTPRKKWHHYFWEFLMLFLAVFCGFLAEYFLEHKIEHDKEKQFISSLVEDLSQDVITLNEIVNDLSQNVARMDSLKFLLCSDDIKNNTSEIYYLGRLASRNAWLSLNDRTIQQMKNSGGFRLIRNEKVSDAIIKYYNRLTFINRLEDVQRSETEEFRLIAVSVFHPVVFDGLVGEDNSINKPAGNPALMTYDRQTLLHMAGNVAYNKNTRLALAKAEREMKEAAGELIKLLKAEYHLK